MIEADNTSKTHLAETDVEDQLCLTKETPLTFPVATFLRLREGGDEESELSLLLSLKFYLRGERVGYRKKRKSRFTTAHS